MSDVTRTTYPLSKQLKINFSPYEDRLIVSSAREGRGDVWLLLTRRMVILVLQQLLAKLPELTGLEKTPTSYWQEVLQLAHQQAMVSKQATDQAVERQRHQQVADSSPASKTVTVNAAPQKLYLASELTVRLEVGQLILAFKGLSLPDAMTMSSRHEPVLAIPLKVENVHQLIQLLILKAQEAQWHLPVELPWMKSAGTDSLTGTTTH